MAEQIEFIFIDKGDGSGTSRPKPVDDGEGGGSPGGKFVNPPNQAPGSPGSPGSPGGGRRVVDPDDGPPPFTPPGGKSPGLDKFIGLSSIPLLGALIQGGSIALGIKTLISVNRQINDHIKNLGQRFQQFSPALQITSARGQVERLRQDIEFARTLGPRLARFNRAQDRTSLAVDRIARTIEGPLLDAIIPIVELLATGAETVAKNKLLLEVIGNAIAQVGIGGGLGQAIIAIAKHFATQDEGVDPAFDLLGMFGDNSDITVEYNGKTYGGGQGAQVANPLVQRQATIPQVFLP